MSLSTHEMLIALRVRDEASRILNRLSSTTMNMATQMGMAMTSVGVGSAVLGGAVAAGLEKASQAYVDYAQDASRTFTQVDNKGKEHFTNLSEVMKIGMDTASKYAVKFEEVQPALYDVFSTIETDGPGAKIILEGIAQAAIGGATTMETAGRSIMGIMNAWKLGAEGVTQVNDIMFQLVRKGVGDFDDFASSFGKVTPSAVKAHQSIGDTAAMLAFMTKNGMSAAMSGTSAARAYDMLSNPKFAANIGDFGVKVFDSTGKIRPMIDVVEDLRSKIAGMSDKQRLDFISEIGKGAGGTIQAMRFMNLGLEDSGLIMDETGDKSVGMFRTLQQQMANSKGAAKDAYDIMSNTPEAKWQKMINQADLFAIAIGKGVQPIRDLITGALTPMFEWFNKLDPSMQQNIATFAAVTAGVLILAGVILTIVGVILMFSGAATAASIAVGAILWPVLLVVAGIAALIAIGYLVITNWNLIVSTAQSAFSSVLAFLQPLFNGFSLFSGIIADLWSKVMPALSSAFNNVLVSLQPFINMIIAQAGPALAALGQAITNMGPALTNLGGFFGGVFGFILMIVTLVGQFVIGILVMIGTVIADTFGGLLAGLSMIFAGIIGVVTGFINVFSGIFTGNMSLVIQGVTQIFGGLVSIIMGAFATLVGGVIGFVTGLVTGVINFFKYLYDVLVGHSIIPDLINAIVNWFQGLPGKVIAFIVNLVTTGIAKFNEFKTQAVAKATELVNGVVTFFSGLPSKAISVISSLAGMLSSQGSAWLSSLGSAVNSGISNVISFFSALPGRITGAIGSVGSLLSSIGASIMTGLYNGLMSAWSKVTDFVGGIANWIATHKGPLSYDAVLLKPAGKAIMGGLNNALRGEMSDLKSVVDDANSQLASIGNGSNSPRYINSSALVSQLLGEKLPVGSDAQKIIHVEQTVNTQEIDPVKHAADLGYEVAKRLG